MIRRSRISTGPIVAWLLIALVIAVAWLLVTRNGTQSPQQSQPAPESVNVESLPAHSLPDRRFTPGAVNSDVTQANIDSTICVPGFAKSIRPPAHYTSRLKREQLDDPERDYDDRNMRDFEEDHDVPLEVGGNPTDPRNLWPEPLDGSWNAHMKDRLENRVHELVCAHAITLDQGQAAFLGDWTASYRRYLEN
jgi:hypothetical protein